MYRLQGVPPARTGFDRFQLVLCLNVRHVVRDCESWDIIHLLMHGLLCRYITGLFKYA